MKSKSLNKKIIKSDKHGELLDFSKPNYKPTSELKLIAYHIVRDYEIMRLDLISYLYYNSSDYIDLILKVNNISNPFAIYEGLELRIPDKNSIDSFNLNVNEVNVTPRTQFLKSKKINPEDKERIEFLKEQSENRLNASSENLPPNMLKSNEKSKTFVNDKIILGSNLKTKK